jgi:hypothetical protein
MSTFGKKSLIWWDYDDDSRQNAIRFNHTDSEMQLKILKKWYPIGNRCRQREKMYRISRAPKYSWEIVDYIISVGNIYTIKIKFITDPRDVYYGREYNLNPLIIELSPDDL